MDTDRKVINIFQHYQLLSDHNDQQEVKKAVSLIKSVLTSKKTDDFYVSFNGGKDATIVLFLTFFAFQELQLNEPIKCLYFEEEDPFVEMDEFMREMQQILNLDIIKLSSKKYQKQLLNFSKLYPLEWIVMGSRRDDPGCSKLNEISESDSHKGYPAFKRVSPIIDWSYQGVWKFIREYKIPYCKLYDEGYTSIGNKKNTKKNMHLYDEKTKTYKQPENGSTEIERIYREK